ncbi:MAG: TetR/AcrR family transcriptional regulator, partial [Oscillospiraceae bacterium]|nr:TetR/AcrR family transcriptional regulator [Oscillospiraceae bacterium]
MARVSRSTTRTEIIQVACEYYFEKGYSATSPKMIASALDISPGNLTYHFPTKEHLLSVVVQMFCEFQWKLLGIEAEKGIDSVGSVCLEMMTVAAACQEDEIA